MDSASRKVNFNWNKTSILSVLFLVGISSFVGSCSDNTGFFSSANDLSHSNDSQTDQIDRPTENDSDDPLEIKAEDDSNLSVSQPIIISGAYLSCTTVKPTQVNDETREIVGINFPENGNSGVGCIVHKKSGEIYSEAIAIQIITVGFADGSSQTYDHFEIPAGGNWHVLFAIPSTKFIEITSITADGTGKEEEFSLEAKLYLPQFLCPEKFVYIFGQTDIEPSTDFCVSKYEMKQDPISGFAIASASEVPWVSISRLNAIDECERMGSGYRLIDNSDWMTIARNIELNPRNWSTQEEGQQRLSSGHSDKEPFALLAASTKDEEACFGTENICSLDTWGRQRRTNILLSDEVIWDIAGNAWEMIDFELVSDKPTTIEGKMNDWLDIINVKATNSLPETGFKPFNRSLGSKLNGIGAYVPGNNGSGGAAQRGGSLGDYEFSGIYTLALDLGISNSGHLYTSFRCAWVP